MKILQNNPQLQIMDVRETGIGTKSQNGMVSEISFIMKGKTNEGKIKEWELKLESFAELDEMINQLSKIRAFASKTNDLARSLKDELKDSRRTFSVWV